MMKQSFVQRFLLALCAISQIARAFMPEQIHMATGTDSSQMILSFITQEEVASELIYSPSKLSPSGDGALKATGEASQYEFGDYKSGYIHKVIITGLTPATSYFYRIGDYDNQGELSFTTLPAPGDNREVTYGVVGDLGQTKFSASTLKHMISDNRISGIMHAGDLSYANCKQHLWDSYGKMIQPLSETLPWMVCVGNHEIEWAEGDTGAGLFHSVEARYPMPQVKPAEFGSISYPETQKYCTPSAFTADYDYGIAYYSYESGLSHVIILSCYSQTGPDSKQYQWLKADLEAIDRTKTPWVFVVEHCPWYNSNKDHQNEEQTIAMKSSMEALFYDNNVNVVFAGHVHAYERSHPVYQDKIDNDRGVVYINIGDGGNKEGHADNYIDPQPEWSAFRNGTYFGHGLLSVHNESALTWQWIRNVDHETVSADAVSICNFVSGSKQVMC
jgi:hypothetical protein